MPTRKQPRKRARAEYLSREVKIVDLQMLVSARIDKQRGVLPERVSHPWIVAEGILAEPLRDTVDVELHITIEDERQPPVSGPPSVGAFTQIRRVASGLVGLPMQSFESVWTMAACGQLKYIALTLVEPHRGYARITNAQFSNRGEDGD